MSEVNEHKVGYVGKRLSMKQAKLYLLSTPKHGPQRQSTMKHWMGLRDRPRGAARTPPKNSNKGTI